MTLFSYHEEAACVALSRTCSVTACQRNELKVTFSGAAHCSHEHGGVRTHDDLFNLRDTCPTSCIEYILPIMSRKVYSKRCDVVEMMAGCCNT